LEAWDYTKPGAYFVTLCTQGRACLFGDVHDGEMRLNALGNIVAGEWVKTREVRHEIELDEWVVMPNHFQHFGHRRIAQGAAGWSPLRHAIPAGPQPRSIGATIAGFKSVAWNTVNACVATDLPRAGPPQ
jgi:hypothetical protein